ncbi:hypothetical protein GGR58DRAFT_494607 [Xylaria digitata]|nr:hypothetical protein GGR58DRAFT_494607 [Xylaria digitata]
MMIMPNSTQALPTTNYQHGSADSEESLSDSHGKHVFKAPAISSTEVSLSWRPLYLRRAVLLGFITVFILGIITIEILLAISNKYNGIGTSDVALSYLWTFGPTAFLTGLAALWARAEYQSKLAAPWMRLSQDAIPASRSLLLDYISPFSIFTITRSWRNRDYIVFITVIVSTIIKILITLSSALITLSLTSVTRNSHPMVSQNRFVNSNARLQTPSTLAPYIIQGLGARNLTLPEGISSDYAYQSVQTNLPNTAETRITVDGLINSITCEPAHIHLAGASSPLYVTLYPAWDSPSEVETLNVTISSPKCNVSLASLRPVTVSGERYNGTRLFARFEKLQCDTVTGTAGRRVLILFGESTYHTVYSNGNYETYGVLNQSTQLLCEPSYAIERVQVTRNNTQTNTIVPIQGSPRETLNSVTAWDIMDAQFIPGQSGFYPYYNIVNISGVPIEVDFYMQPALQFYSAPDIQAISLFDHNILQQAVGAYYRQIGAIIAKQSLMEPASVDIIGSAAVNENRLIVRSWIAQWMIGLLAICVLLTAIALFMVPKDGFLPCSPHTLLNLISIVQHGGESLSQLRSAGASDGEHLARYLKSHMFRSRVSYNSASNQFSFYFESKANENNTKAHAFPQIHSKIYHPTVLHPASRSILYIGVAGLIITLELLLYKSSREDGLGDINDDQYIHYTWTAIPALIFGATSMAFSAVDFETRNLTPYMMMKQYVLGDKFMQLDFLDVAVPQAIYRELKMGTRWAFAITTAFLIASLFTTFSASLFQESSIPFTTFMVLRAEQSFPISISGPVLLSRISSQISSLILGSNYSFPRFVYKDLAFPELAAITIPSSASILNASIVSILATVPAIRSHMDCRLYESTQIVVDLTLNHTKESGKSYSLSASIPEEKCDDAHDTHFRYIHKATNVTYVGEVAGRLGSTQGCSDLLYFWANIDYNAKPALQNIAAFSCNTSFEAVDSEVTFIGTGLDLDLRNPPRPLKSTARKSTLDKSSLPGYFPYEYAGVASLDVSPQLLDPFFAVLVTSPWAIPMSDLGDPSASGNIHLPSGYTMASLQRRCYHRCEHLQIRLPQLSQSLSVPEITTPKAGLTRP